MSYQLGHAIGGIKMSGKKNAPIMKNFTINVVLPTYKMLTFCFQGTDVHAAEKFFGELAIHQSDPLHRDDCQRCQLMLKWANSCNAMLKKVTPALEKGNKSAVSFIFCFSEHKDMEMFIKDLEVNLA